MLNIIPDDNYTFLMVFTFTAAIIVNGFKHLCGVAVCLDNTQVEVVRFQVGTDDAQNSKLSSFLCVDWQTNKGLTGSVTS